jgi:hypothetical protein
MTTNVLYVYYSTSQDIAEILLHFVINVNQSINQTIKITRRVGFISKFVQLSVRRVIFTT